MKNQDFTCRSFLLAVRNVPLLFRFGIRPGWFGILINHYPLVHMACSATAADILKLGESLFRCAASTRSPRQRRGAAPPRGRCRTAQRRNPRRPKTGFFPWGKKTAVFAKCCACFLELARHLAYVSKPFLATSAA